MRIVDIAERSIPISRYESAQNSTDDLTTSLVRIAVEPNPGKKPVFGFGYASVGRFAQGGLIRERFAPRLMYCDPRELLDESGIGLDPRRAWKAMMRSEKPGGHGERCIAVGALDMAIWDAAAKIAKMPLYQFYASFFGRESTSGRVPVYASGGYPYPANDAIMLSDEVKRMKDLGYSVYKIKIGYGELSDDLRRIEVVADCLSNMGLLAVDAMSRYSARAASIAASTLGPLGLRWLEDFTSPLDLPGLSHLTANCLTPVAVGESLFSLDEAKLVLRYGGLRESRDKLLFDPIHCYGLTEYARIVNAFLAAGWSTTAFWPHGGHLFAAHIASALRLGGAEVTPFAFYPFSSLGPQAPIQDGWMQLPDAPGIGLETCPDVLNCYARAFGR